MFCPQFSRLKVRLCTYVRRECSLKERELLCGRLIDRLIRPFFPARFYHEGQVCVIEWLVSCFLINNFILYFFFSHS
uniref:Putative ribosomal protein S5 domain 2-type fold, PNPase/RNase PH domain protein n=1 Tax=Helianthus annuus TaxID=4232 RepID=A0A251UMK5_HELAN